MFGRHSGEMLGRVASWSSVGVKQHLRMLGIVQRNVDAVLQGRCFSSPNAPQKPPGPVPSPPSCPPQARPRKKNTRRDITLEESLAKRYPALARELHPTKNSNAVDARKLTPDSPLRVWWKCAQGEDHEWETKVYHRARVGYGCPFCAHRRVSVTNSLRTLAPSASLQWHHEKNGEKTPETIVGTSTSKYWFRGHVAYIKETREVQKVVRFEGETIKLSPRSVSALESPEVKGARNTKHPSLAAAYPELARFWHPSRNTHTPHAVTVRASYIAWWKCARGHEFQSDVNSVTRPIHGVVPQEVPCRQCTATASPGTSVLDLFPEVAAEYDAAKNERPVHEIHAANNSKFWFLCQKCGHSWKTAMKVRTRAVHSSGCPECAKGSRSSRRTSGGGAG